jgi:hypothetical protein
VRLSCRQLIALAALALVVLVLVRGARLWVFDSRPAAAVFQPRAPQTQAEIDQEACLSPSAAYWGTQDQVKATLLYPETASFASIFDVTFSILDNCRHEIQAYVEAQNGYGATVRHRYTVVARYAGKRQWQVERLTFHKEP